MRGLGWPLQYWRSYLATALVLVLRPLERDAFPESRGPKCCSRTLGSLHFCVKRFAFVGEGGANMPARVCVFAALCACAHKRGIGRSWGGHMVGGIGVDMAPLGWAGVGGRAAAHVTPSNLLVYGW
jgi:hypothetical protein